jgi:hypothetical protein
MAEKHRLIVAVDDLILHERGTAPTSCASMRRGRPISGSRHGSGRLPRLDRDRELGSRQMGSWRMAVRGVLPARGQPCLYADGRLDRVYELHKIVEDDHDLYRFDAEVDRPRTACAIGLKITDNSWPGAEDPAPRKITAISSRCEAFTLPQR